MKKLLISLGALLLISTASSLMAWHNQLPPGSYLDTCRHCMVRGRELSCMCRDRAGFKRGSSLFVSSRCNWVENIDGRLFCAYRGKKHGYQRDVKAGPIWNRRDASIKCPIACTAHGRSWTGEWRTIRMGNQSVCGCR